MKEELIANQLVRLETVYWERDPNDETHRVFGPSSKAKIKKIYSFFVINEIELHEEWL